MSPSWRLSLHHRFTGIPYVIAKSDEKDYIVTYEYIQAVIHDIIAQRGRVTFKPHFSITTSGGRVWLDENEWQEIKEVVAEAKKLTQADMQKVKGNG
jgi:hypothetical protein